MIPPVDAARQRLGEAFDGLPASDFDRPRNPRLYDCLVQAANDEIDRCARALVELLDSGVSQ